MPESPASRPPLSPAEESGQQRSRLTRLRGRFAPGGFTRAIAVLAGGTALGQLILLAGSPILTRVYSPDDLGLFGLYTSFVATASLVLSLRYEAAIVSAATAGDAAVLVLLSAWLIAPVAAVACAGLWMLIAGSALGYGPLPMLAVGLAFLSLLVTGAFFVARYWLLRVEQFAIISQIAVLQNAGRVAGQLGLAPLGMGWCGLVVGDVVGRFLGLTRAIRRSIPDVKESWPSRRGEARRVAWAYREFPLYSAPSTLLDSLATVLPVPLIARLYGTSAAGQFFLVTQALAVPAAIVAMSVADAFHSRLAVIVRAGRGGARRFFLRTSVALLAIGAVPALVLLFAGRPLFAAVFGARWAAAGTLASAIAPWFLASFVVSPVSRVVFVLRGQRAKLIRDLLAVGGVVGALAWARVRGLGLERAVAVLSLVSVIVYICYYLILLAIVARSAPSGGPPQPGLS